MEELNTTFEILYEDESLIVINKPYGILVHRTKISEDTSFVFSNSPNGVGINLKIHRSVKSILLVRPVISSFEFSAFFQTVLNVLKDIKSTLAHLV